MIKPRLFVCSEANAPLDGPLRENRHVVELNTQGSNPDVHLILEDVAKVAKRDLTPRLVDFLEIAAYVYAADACTDRGGAWSDDDTTEPWDRNFLFVLPVRDLAFWSQESVARLLRDVL